MSSSASTDGAAMCGRLPRPVSQLDRAKAFRTPPRFKPQRLPLTAGSNAVMIASVRRRPLITPCSKYVMALVAVLALVIAGGASAFVISHASSHVVQPQPPPGSCHVRGHYPFNMPDPHCTPGALNPAVTQATIHKTICRRGYSSSIRPSTSVTGPEKLASIRAYGFHRGPGQLRVRPSHLAGAGRCRQRQPQPLAGERRVTEPERQGGELPPRARVRRPHVARPRTAHHRARLGFVLQPERQAEAKGRSPPSPPPPPPSPPDEGVVHPGAFCSPRGRDRPHQRGYADGVRASFRWPRSLAQRLEAGTSPGVGSRAWVKTWLRGAFCSASVHVVPPIHHRWVRVKYAHLAREGADGSRG